MKLLDILLCSVLEHMDEAIVGIDAEGKIIIINKKAETYLEVSYKDNIGKKVTEIISNTPIMNILSDSKPQFNQKFKYNNKEFLVNRIPIIKDSETLGAISIFKDMTEFMEMNERMIKDESYIDVLNTILDTVNEWVVVVDDNGIIQMMSKAYKEFLKEPEPEGKHVTDVIENTRMHIVAKSGTREVGEIQEIKGNKMIPMRIPIKKEGKVVGAVGKVMFKDLGDFQMIKNKVQELEKELEYYKSEYDNNRSAKYTFNSIIGVTDEIMELKRIGERVAKSKSNVIITGESGTGKELFAHAIHNASNRRLGPFVRINCAAIPGELLESELFGYEEGAFTGAKRGGKKGKFEIANGGTILLDEIGDMPLNMQAKLLRVLQEKEFESVGGNVVKDLDVRIITSTNKNLRKLVEEKKFREDFYYRLNVVTLNLPPLRERKEDIKELALSLKNKLTKKLGIYVEGISKRTIEYLENYDWPGNIRELENVIERAINLLDSELIIEPHHLPERITRNRAQNIYTGKKKLKTVLDEVERDMIIEYLKRNDGNKNQTAKVLGISRVSLYKKLDKYNLKDV
ncbi:sigma 54-interacting transcriptional regulator [Clostridium sp. D2Q-11]|uniref:Sigma 54-interacting transcriptional regulator n=1 Tax=Anaeromonas frigoriresistens TaxID=2683708 RepID=A0A942US71_9FIRM|nr:sigma 54-interacting transcriptional regulator [Anaeromonas frigoriresistens]MBS4536955.1 sigma 54-interacting transcriptional regulator [Anaeromonas frigoriresistens]